MVIGDEKAQALANPKFGSQRVGSLDGLRGTAALVVVLHHCMLCGVGDAILDFHRTRGIGAFGWALGYTPLHLFWDGNFAVYIFFVLSGYVLTLQMGRSPRRPWLEYYLHRLPRLYLPAWVSLLWSGLIFGLLTNKVPTGSTRWLVGQSGVSLRHGAVSAGTLMHDNVPLNGPLWSLKWEVLFSLALPIAIWLGRRFSQYFVSLQIPLLAVVAVGAHQGREVLLFPPMFGMGVLLAYNRKRVAGWVTSWSSSMWVVAGVVVALGEWSLWILLSGGYTPDRDAIGTTLQVLVVPLLMVIVTCCPAVVRLAQSRPVHWLGLRSFALYLTHNAIVVTAAVLVGPHVWAIVLVAVPISLVVAEIFGRLVEAPSNELSKRFARSVYRLTSRTQPAV